MWNHRIIRHETGTEEEYLAVHEVYYDDDNNPHSCTSEPIHIIEEDLEGMKWTISKIQEATDKPILEYQYFLDMEKGSEQ